MDLKRPSRLVGAANEPANLLIGRWLLGEVVDVGLDAAKAKCCRYAAMARAGGVIRHV